MSGLDMRKIMENLNTETPKKKVKLDESLGGTPMANDIMELAAKIEAVQAAAEAKELAESEEVDETEEDEAEKDEAEKDEAEDEDEDEKDETLKETLMPDQRSVTDQLTDLVEMANKQGMYDAADWVTRAMTSRNGVMKYGPGALLGASE